MSCTYGALCRRCVGPWEPGNAVAEAVLTKNCKLCMGTEMDPIPWSELFTCGREYGGDLEISK